MAVAMWQVVPTCQTPIVQHDPAPLSGNGQPDNPRLHNQRPNGRGADDCQGQQKAGVPGSLKVRAPRDQSQDQSLHAGIAAGDPAALAEVHLRYARFLHAVAARVTGDHDAADEVVQDVLVHLWEHPLRFDPDRGDLRTYLAVLARRRAVDWVRREVARRPKESAAVALAEIGTEPGADEALVACELAARVRRGVTELPRTLREVVELAFFAGLTYREVAAHLGIPEGTAKSRIRAALHSLARRLDREGVRP